MSENTGGQTDVAALSAGVIAGAVVQYTSPGQYDWLNVVMGITLFMVVATYVWEHKRMWWKSVAVGCVLAFTVLPLFGAIYDGLLASIFHDPPCRYNDAYDKKRIESCMPNWLHFLLWVLLTLAFFAGDRYLQRRRGDRETEQKPRNRIGSG